MDCDIVWSNFLKARASNHIFITLIPKTPNTSKISEFRTIARVDMIYKLQTKIVTTKLGHVSDELVSPKQTTIIGGRVISGNTLLANEMIHEFGRKRTHKRCCVSIDLKKPILTLSDERP